MTKKDRSDLASMLPLFGDLSDGDESYCLYRYSAITDRQKTEFDSRVRMFTEQAGGAESLEVAEINSGIPALEGAIRDYVEKYAVSIKLKNAHDAFMRKVRAREMVDRREAAWASSKDTLAGIRAEIQEKRRVYQENKELAAFRDKIGGINVDKRQLYAREAELREEIDRLFCRSKTMRKDRAEHVLQYHKSRTEEVLKRAGTEAVKLLNESVLKPCNELLKGYTHYVQSLEDQGLLDLGGISVRELDGFEDLSMDSVDDMLHDSAYIFEKKVSAGSRRVEKDGALNWLKRFLGIASGWDEKEVQKRVEFVRVEDLIRDRIAENMEAFHNALEHCIREAEEQVREAKQRTGKRLERVDKRIGTLLMELEEKVSDEERLAAEVKANEEDLRWMKRFIDRVDKILEIE